MDIRELKQYILSNDLTETILENLNCHHIQCHGNKYYTCGNPDGDNKSAITVYLNEYLTVVNYTRNLEEKNIQTDIFSLIKYIKQCNFFESIKIACDWFGLDYYHDFKQDLPESLLLTKALSEMNQHNTDVEEQCLKPIPEHILSYYGRYVTDLFAEDGIDYLTQDYFELGYDDYSNYITIPIRDAIGTLVGVKGRYFGKEIPDNKNKYIYLEPCAKSQLLYGLYQNHDYIKDIGRVYVGESEKFVMQLYSYGFYNAVALGGKKISKTQIEYLTRLCVDIVFCFDKDVSEEEIFQIADLFGENIPLYYIYDHEGLLNEKESPSDNKEHWKQLIKNNVYKIEK